MRMILKLTVIVVLLAGLSGCFKSGAPLIVAANADFPFTTLTYANVGSDDKITLVRDGDKYVNSGEDDGAAVLLQAISKNVFVAQISAPDDDKTIYLYGLIKVSADRKSFEIVKGYAEPDDVAAARQGQPGFSVCDDDQVCVATLKAYVAYAQAAPPAQRPARFQILTLE